jgi:hypothetical protein
MLTEKPLAMAPWYIGYTNDVMAMQRLAGERARFGMLGMTLNERLFNDALLAQRGDLVEDWIDETLLWDSDWGMRRQDWENYLFGLGPEPERYAAALPRCSFLFWGDQKRSAGYMKKVAGQRLEMAIRATEGRTMDPNRTRQIQVWKRDKTAWEDKYFDLVNRNDLI